MACAISGVLVATSPRPTRTTYGASRFNAPGFLAGLDFTADSRALLALVSGAKTSRLVSFSMTDGAVVERRDLEGAWFHVRALAGGEVILWSRDQIRRLSSNGEILWTIEKPAPRGGVAVARDGAYVVTFGGGSDAQLWDGARGGPLHTLRGGADGEIYAAAFSASGEALVTGSSKGVIRLFDTRTGAELAKGKSTQVGALAFSPAGERVLSGHGTGRVALWDARTLKPVPAFRAEHTFGAGGGAGCRWVAFSPDGERAFSLGNERRLRSWSVPEAEGRLNLEVPARHQQGSATALSPDGRWVATGSTEGALSVWSAEDGEPQVRDAAPSPALGLALTPHAVAVASDRSCVSWSRTTGQRAEVAVNFPPADVKGLSSGLLVRLDYDSIYAGESLDPDAPSAFELGSYASGPLAMSRGEALVAVPVQNMVEIWDLKRSARLAELPHENRITACAFGPNDAWVVTADSALHLWRLGNGQQPEAIRDIDLKIGPYGVVRGLAVSGRGWVAVSVDRSTNHYSAESALRVVDPRSGAIVASLERPGVRLGQVAWVGGARVAVTDSSGRLLLADALEGRWLEAPEPGDLGPERHELVAHPIASHGDAVAHVGPDGNVVVSTLEATRPDDGEPFLLERQPQAAGAEAAAQPATPAPGGVFEDRLAGKRFFFAGRFKDANKDFRELTVKELGGSVAPKADARVTHVVLGEGAAQTAVDALKAKGVSVTTLSEKALIQLLLPTPEESRAMLRGEIKTGVERWNRWRARYQGPRGERFPAQLVGIDLSGMDLREARLAVLDLTEARLAGADLSKVDLFDTVFRRADLRGANLSGARCYRTVFSGADLRNARLGVDLTSARFDGADLRDADLSGADLRYADLGGADLRGARLPADLSKVKHDAKTRWPEGAGPG